MAEQARPAVEPLRHLTADLTFSVESDSGSAQGTVVGDGGVLRVVTDAPVTVLSALRSIDGDGRLPEMAERLADLGVTVEVSGPSGVVARAGAGVDSRAGLLVARTRRVQLVDPRSALPLARAAVPWLVPALVGGAIAAVAVVVAVVAGRRR